MGGNNINNNHFHHGFTPGGGRFSYQKLGEGSNMPTDSSQMTNAGELISVSVDNNSSVGSNNSSTAILGHPGLKRGSHNYTEGQSACRPSKLMRALNDDTLAKALMDNSSSTEGLENFNEWRIDLRKLIMGTAFVQGAFGRIYRGTYDGEEVAIKILENPDNDPERTGVMEQQFQKEVMMLATLKHPNIVQFIWVCRKPMAWCIVTEYAKGGSARQFLCKRRPNQAVPLKLAVKQALNVAKGMAYVHELGYIHRGLKSDKLLIAADKSIKIADFGFALD